MPSDRASVARFYFQAALIVVPVIALAWVGFSFVRQDKFAVEQEARELAATAAQAVAENIWQQITNISFPGFDTNWAGDKLFFRLSPEGALLEPRPLAPLKPFSLASLPAPIQTLWAQAEAAEFAEKSRERALQVWETLLAHPDLPATAAPLAAYHAAVLERSLSNEANAIARFAEVARSGTRQTSETGAPLRELALLQMLTPPPSSGENPTPSFLQMLMAPPSPGDARTELTLLIESIVSEPSLLTEFLVAAARDAGLPISPRFEQHENARTLASAFFAKTNAALDDLTLLGNNTGSADPSSKSWVILPLPDGTNIFAARPVSPATASAAFASLPNSLRAPYFALSTTIAGDPLDPEPSSGPTLARASFGGPLHNAVQVTVTLSNPSTLYARQESRARWFRAVIIGSALIALLGVVNAWRSFHRERRLSQLKTNFVSSVSHELRAPIASISLLAEGLAGGRIRDPEKQGEYFNFILQECRRLSALIQNVLDFARIDEGRREYNFEPANPAALIDRALLALQPLIHEKALVIEREIAGAPSEATLDPAAICQALINLLDNAIKHSAQSATIVIGCTAASAEIQFWVEDAGPGIPAAEHQKIFDRFYRVGSELRRTTEGTGIGLSIVKHITEAHGGQVHLHSSPGHGSKFTLWLPQPPLPHER